MRALVGVLCNGSGVQDLGIVVLLGALEVHLDGHRAYSRSLKVGNPIASILKSNV